MTKKNNNIQEYLKAAEAEYNQTGKVSTKTIQEYKKKMEDSMLAHIKEVIEKNKD